MSPKLPEVVKIIKKPKYRINAEKNEHNVTLTEEQQEVANKVRTSKIPRQQKSKRIEETRVRTACQVIEESFKNILNKN